MDDTIIKQSRKKAVLPVGLAMLFSLIHCKIIIFKNPEVTGTNDRDNVLTHSGCNLFFLWGHRRNRGDSVTRMVLSIWWESGGVR